MLKKNFHSQFMKYTVHGGFLMTWLIQVNESSDGLSVVYKLCLEATGAHLFLTAQIVLSLSKVLYFPKFW